MVYTKKNINKNNIPEHVAIIMDGNGRWATKNGKDRLFGHQNAIKAVRESTEAASELGIKFLTLYAFSNENWNRPKEEVNGLMELLMMTIETETATLKKNNVRLISIGNMKMLPENANLRLQKCVESTSMNTGLTLILALSYSSRWEIVEATKKIAQDVLSNNINLNDIDEELISENLTTKGIPNPDLLIRTSGEFRVSNFLLWQISYSELYFTDILWPDFNKQEFYKAILNYQKRERRFGKTSDQVSK